MKNEIEAKFLSIDKELIRSKLQKEGYNLLIPEYMMRRKTFDFLNISSDQKKWGRVRQEADKITMTVKEIRGISINDTYESEIVVNDFDDACAFFEACGLKSAAFQENFREVWKKNDQEITIDTWPSLDPFIEIEGPDEREIFETAKRLDLDIKQAVFGSIDLIYEKELSISKEDFNRLPEITFVNPPKKDVA